MTMVMMTTTMFFFKKALKYQSKKYETNSCNPKRGKQNETKNKNKKKEKEETSSTLFALKIDRSTENGMENR
jgi:hypothetical protein